MCARVPKPSISDSCYKRVIFTRVRKGRKIFSRPTRGSAPQPHPPQPPPQQQQQQQNVKPTSTEAGKPGDGEAGVRPGQGDKTSSALKTGDGQAAQSGAASDDIEEMANNYFHKIYTSDQSISDVIEMLKRFKASSNTREQDIFACMIHNLFDEYRFFHKYPEKELRITGILFGMLIQHQLVSSITLGIALRYVLEALRKPQWQNGKMFRFGMFALNEFSKHVKNYLLRAISPP